MKLNVNYTKLKDARGEGNGNPLQYIQRLFPREQKENLPVCVSKVYPTERKAYHSA